MRRFLVFTSASLAGTAVLALVVQIATYFLWEQVHRHGKAGRHEQAADRAMVLASIGNGAARSYLGESYARGLGVRRDRDRALYWFRRGADRDGAERDPAARSALAVGKSFAAGHGGYRVDLAESAWWLQVAADGGSEEAARLVAEQVHTP